MKEEFQKLREEAFETISRNSDCKKLKKEEIHDLNLTSFHEVWSYQLDINPDGMNILSVKVFICLKSNFPVSLPKIYLSKSDFDRYKYIPHVDTNYLICTFDKENISYPFDNPSYLIQECLSESRKILENGISKKNYDDFTDEFLSYWKLKYDSKQEASNKCLTIISQSQILDKNEIFLVKLDQKINLYWYILGDYSSRSSDFLNFIEDKNGIGYSNLNFFFITEFDNDIPPFSIKYIDLIELLDEERIDKLKEFINENKPPFHFILRKKNKDNFFYLLLRLDPMPINQAGFRKQTNLYNFRNLKKFQKQTPLLRFEPQIYTPERVGLRTSGTTKNLGVYKLAFIGLGSVGSNLLQYLFDDHISDLLLIDNDILSIENINRHLLGFPSINLYKSKALKWFFQQNSPFTNIKSITKDLSAQLVKQPKTLDDYDYAFLSTANNPLENWYSQELQKGNLKTPTFFLWVEPYLAAGHLIFLHPEDSKKRSELFINTLFKNNVINEKEYLERPEKLTSREAGCQTTFTPYSNASLKLFLSSIHGRINDTIFNNSKNSFAITWVGNIAKIEDMNIEKSDFGKDKSQGELIEVEWK